MRWRVKLIICFALVDILISFSSVFVRPSQARDLVRIFVPTLDGPRDLAENVSTVLVMRLWTSLRPIPLPNPTGLNFGYGQVKWSRVKLPDPSVESARRAAVDTESQLILWGFVQPYGPGTIVQSFLTVAPNLRGRRGFGTGNWFVDSRGIELSIFLPSNTFQFSPLLLASDVVSKYSRPNQILVCTEKSTKCDGRRLSPQFRAIRQDGDWALVRLQDGYEGWIFLPDLSQAQGEVVDFSSGLIAYFRGDFERAAQYFDRVNDSEADPTVRYDAATMAAISDFRRGKGLDRLRAVNERNPYSRFAAQALAMGYITLSNQYQEAQKRRYLEAAKEIVTRHENLFGPSDTWLLNARKIIDEE